MSASVTSLSREKGALVHTGEAGEGGICDTDGHGRLRDTRVLFTHALINEPRVYTVYNRAVRCACALWAVGSLRLVIGSVIGC